MFICLINVGALWCICQAVVSGIIRSGNGPSPVRCQFFTSSNWVSVKLKGTHIDKILFAVLYILSQEIQVKMSFLKRLTLLNHWDPAMHICIGKLTTIGWDNDFTAPSHYLTQCWNILIRTLGNNLQCNCNRNTNMPFTKMHMKTSFAKWLQFCHGPNVLSFEHINKCIDINVWWC